MAEGHGPRGQRPGQHRERPFDPRELEIDDRLGRHVLVGRVAALQLGDQQIGRVSRHGEDDRPLGRVVRETGRVDHVVIGIEQEHVDAVFGHASAQCLVQTGIVVRAEALLEGH